MNTFRKILVPTDFSASAAEATERALALARAFDAELTLLHVCPPPSDYGYAEGLGWPIDDMAGRAMKALDVPFAKLKERHARVERFVDIGDPALQILAAVESRAFDLVVMGTHGRHGLAHLVLGSVAEKVVRHSRVPVLTVRVPVKD